MTTETLLRALLLTLTVVIYGTRLTYELRIPKTKAKHGLLEIGLIAAMCLWTSSLLVYPWGFTWFEFSLPLSEWVRWGGVGCMVASLPLSIWVYRTLGVYFSTKINLLENHALIVSGPYRIVRHPMYATFTLCALGTTLTSANLIVAATSSIPVALMYVRTKKEEVLLADRFGDAYHTYRQQTGALLPRLLQWRHVRSAQ